MLGQINKSMVLVTTGSDAPHYGGTVGSRHTIILPIASRTRQLLYVLGILMTPVLI
jgi:hypothetical protein